MWPQIDPPTAHVQKAFRDVSVTGRDNRSFSPTNSAVIAEKDQCYFVASVKLSNKALTELVLIFRNRLRYLGTYVRADHFGCL